MQWFSIVGPTSPAGGSVGDLMEAEASTGLSIRGGFVWLIHMVQFFFLEEIRIPDMKLEIALSTRKGLPTMPRPQDSGYIAGRMEAAYAVTTGAWLHGYPLDQHFLPPMPLASPTISAYYQTEGTQGRENAEWWARVGFTTAPLTPAVYTEIAEPWGW